MFSSCDQNVFHEASASVNCVLSALVRLLELPICEPITHVPTVSKQSLQRQVSHTFVCQLVTHACTAWMLQASAAGGNINECDQCCHVVEEDERGVDAPQ